MRQPTDEKIRNAAYSLTLAHGGGVVEYANMEQAIREILDAQQEFEKRAEAETPALKRWPPALELYQISKDDWRLRKPVGGTGVDYFKAWEKRHAEAALLALNMLPEAVAILRWHQGRNPVDYTIPLPHDFRERCQARDALLARIDAAGFDLPKP